jgi:MFS transporter, CP family, cyanate transporter
MAEQKFVSFRWVMLGLGCFLQIIYTWNIMSIPALAKYIMAELNLTYAMFMSLSQAATLASIVLAILGGALADRFGIKRTIIIAGLIGGVFGILKGFSTSYVQFLIFTLLQGFGAACLMPNMAKLVRDWFPPRQIGIANGINAAGHALGMTLGLALTYPVFGTQWRLALYGTNGLFILVVVIWFIIAKEIKRETKTKPSLILDISRASKQKDIWMISLISALTMGGGMFFVQLSPVAFMTARSAGPTIAGAIASLNTIGAFAGNLITSYVSDKIGLRKPFLIFSPLLGGIFLYLTWNLPFGVYTCIFTVLSGLFAGGLVSILTTTITEHPSITQSFLGTAIGFRTSISNIFTFSISLLGGYIVDMTMGYDFAFLYAAILLAISSIFGIFTSETGTRRRILKTS